MRKQTRMRWRRTSIAASALIGFGVLGCSPEQVVGNSPLPPTIADPKATETPAGAVMAYRGVLGTFAVAFGGGNGGSFIASSGVISDELQTASIGEPAGAADYFTALDARLLPEVRDSRLETNTPYVTTYGLLHAVRGQAEEARGLLIAFGGDTLRPLVARLAATEGYADIFLADLFCSGIPLSTIDFGGDYTFQPGSSTTDVYQRAVILMDSALALAADSTRFQNFARVGKGRALLALGRFSDAAQAVAGVPDGFQYEAFYFGGFGGQPNFAVLNTNNSTRVNFTVSDREGFTGLNYRTSGDARTASTAVATNPYGQAMYHPDKYATDGSGPIVVADWVEARLIEAEAALQGGDVTTWLGKLNHLRETAISPALADTTDPGTPGPRVDLLFRERAFWLFLTGHRQGDLRRLIRQYGRIQSQVYPTGSYAGGPGGYGVDTNAPIPASERLYNPQFTGCLSRGA